jgi:hypothetical protein
MAWQLQLLQLLLLLLRTQILCPPVSAHAMYVHAVHNITQHTLSLCPTGHHTVYWRASLMLLFLLLLAALVHSSCLWMQTMQCHGYTRSSAHMTQQPQLTVTRMPV